MPSFSRRKNDWEVESVARLLRILHWQAYIKEDRLVWKGCKDGVFSVRSLYLFYEQGGGISFPAKAIWKPWILPKVCFFV